MIPKKLTIKGLYSYQEKQVIDFEKLTSAGLFGIFGAVGSGKSTILEAISYVLYGESERLNRHDERFYNMMNLKSNEMFIEFEFENNEGELYKLISRSKRNKKNFKNVPTNIYEAYKFINNQWQAFQYKPEKDAEKITGINYDNFKRTIVIPQGKFQEFMLLKPAERNNMLKELFNLQRYDIGDNFKILENNNKTKIDIITGQLKTLGNINNETLLKLEEDTKKIKEEYNVLQQQLTQLQQQLQISQQAEKNANSLTTKQNEFQNLLLKEPEIQQLKTNTNNYEKLFFLVKSDIDKYQQLIITLKEIINKINETQQKNNTYQKELTILQQDYYTIRKEYENKEQIIFTNEALKKILEISKKTIEIKNLKKRIDNGNEKVKEVNNKAEQLQNYIKNNNEKLLILKTQLPDITKLSKIKEWRLHENMLQTNKNEIKSKILQLEKKIKQKNEEIEILFSKNNFNEFLPEKNNKETIQHQITEKIKTAELQIKNYEPQLLHLKIQQQLQDYAKALKDGEPCPLCGSKEHPAKLQIIENTKLLTKIEEEIQKQQTTITNLVTFEKKYVLLQHDLQQLQEQYQQLNNDNENVEHSIHLHQQQFIWEEEKYLDLTQIKEKLDAYEQMQQQINTIEQKNTTLNEELEKLKTEQEKYSFVLQDFQQQAAGLEATINLLKQQIESNLLNQYSSCTELEIESLITKNNHRLNTLQQQYEIKEKELQKFQNLVQQTTVTLNHLQQQQQEITLQSETTKKTIDEKLIQNTNFSYTEAEKILSTPINLQEQKNKIQQYEEQINSLKQQINELTSELKIHPYNKQEHTKISQKYESLKENEKTLLLKIGEQEAQLNEGKQKLETAKNLQLELELLNTRQSDINTLKNLFKASAFTNYIATMHMQNLCRAANKRFYQLTKHQLSLELTEDNSFQIRDYMNEGHIRHIKTLSGGQTFQASLCLALALADNNQQLSKSKKNFFFLDEGFGTLDKESLQIVFETLQTLRNENRIVGLISHVEEMQQEINTYLYITNDNERGSIVKASWE